MADEESHLTLHEAMADVLRECGAPMKSRDLADLINVRRLYRPKSGKPLGASQVSARARRYPQLFEREGELIRLL